MIQISLVIKLVMAQQVIIQISLGLVYEATNASFQISLVLTLVKTHQVLVNQISLVITLVIVQ
jgi:hypothetical protein